MRKLALLTALLALGAGTAQAQSETEKEVMQAILHTNAYTKEHLKGPEDDYSSKGSLEFWSSGGLLQEIPPGGGPDPGMDSYSVDVKHIRIITLVEGQAAVAHYYAEGSMKPKGSAAVPHYLTRVTQVFVKEDGKWKVRASHWSPIAGGSGTSQSALDE